MSTQFNTEIKQLRRLLGKTTRHQQQLNRLNESDAELVQLKTGIIASKVDIISDEIHWGLYRSPFLIGWMSALCSLSDLTVTGAKPIGLLLGTHWGQEFTTRHKQEFYKGVRACLKKHHTQLLGGDTSHGKETVISSTSLGQFPELKKPLLRKKIHPGDCIFACGVFGPGPALGLRVLMKAPEEIYPEKLFLPALPKIKNLHHCHAAIDVSDGIASSLCILSEINQVSFDIEFSKTLFRADARNFCDKLKLPLSALFFAEHGDYQPLYAVAAKYATEFQKKNPCAQLIAKAKTGSKPHRLKSRQNDWTDVQLDIVYNADKSNLSKLHRVFQNWVAMAHRLHLP